MPCCLSENSGQSGLVGGLPMGMAWLTLGGHREECALIAKSTQVGEGGQHGEMLYAIGAANNNGPW